jgi:hypothetical protein
MKQILQSPRYLEVGPDRRALSALLHDCVRSIAASFIRTSALTG